MQTLRYKQWTKNFFLFAGLIFARQVFVLSKLARVSAGFLAFCLISSALYIFNDLIDLENDRTHTRKSLRPLARGAISVKAAIGLMVVSMAAGLGAAFILGLDFFLLALFYIAIITGYTLFLKKMVIIDVMIIAAGFVLRTFAGTVVIDVEISPWLLVCTLLLSLFLALVKRRQELLTQKKREDNKGIGRHVLEHYTLEFLDQAITIITAATLTGYFLYTFSTWHGEQLMLTIPFVLYGIFRYLLLTHRQGLGEEPEEVLLADFPFIINLLLWIISSVVLIYI